MIFSRGFFYASITLVLFRKHSKSFQKPNSPMLSNKHDFDFEIYISSPNTFLKTPIYTLYTSKFIPRTEQFKITNTWSDHAFAGKQNIS